MFLGLLMCPRYGGALGQGWPWSMVSTLVRRMEQAPKGAIPLCCDRGLPCPLGGTLRGLREQRSGICSLTGNLGGFSEGHGPD